MNNSTKKIILNRDLFPDILKGIALILMIQVHILQVFGLFSVQNSFIGKILFFLGGPPVAPIFLGIMGYYLSKSKKTLNFNLIRGLKLIFLGLILNILLNFSLLVKWFISPSDLSPTKSIFAIDILFCAGISILIISLIREVFKERIISYLICILIINLIFISQGYSNFNDTDFIKDYLLAFFIPYTDWSYFPLFPWINYSMLGFALNLFINKYKNRKIFSHDFYIVSYLVSFLVTLIGIEYGVETSSNLKEYYKLNPIFFLWTLAFIYFWIISIKIILGFDYKFILHISDFLSILGKQITAYYVIQWIIIGNIGTYIFRSQNLIQIFGWNLITLPIVYFIYYIYQKYIKQNIKLINF